MQSKFNHRYLSLLDTDNIVCIVWFLVHGNDKDRNSHETLYSTSKVESTFVTHEYENRTDLIPISNITTNMNRLIKDSSEKMTNTSGKIMVSKEFGLVPPLMLVNDVVNGKEITNGE